MDTSQERLDHATATISQLLLAWKTSIYFLHYIFIVGLQGDSSNTEGYSLMEKSPSWVLPIQQPPQREKNTLYDS